MMDGETHRPLTHEEIIAGCRKYWPWVETLDEAVALQREESRTHRRITTPPERVETEAS